MPEVFDWRNAADRRDVVRRAAEALTAGRLVAFPTETVYGLAASALDPGAVARLREGKGRPEDKPLTVAVRGAGEALDWAPAMGVLGRRLARRCWPGPVTLVFGDAERGVAGRLPDEVRRAVCPSGTVGLRAPAHEAILATLAALAGPLVLTSANRSGEPAAVTAEQVVAAVGDGVDLVIDDGPSRYGRASTVVEVNGGGWRVLREGVVPEDVLRQQSACLVVFVCTGNTCRSPLAEALCKKLLADRLGCGVEELPPRGFAITSAGLAAAPGCEAASEAVEVARGYAADLARHQSQPLTPELAAQADYLVGMTRGHVQALADHFPRLGCRPRLLSAGGEDLADPIGGDEAVYRECAGQIWRHLEGLVAELGQP